MKLPSLLFLAAVSALPAATLTVTNTDDSGPGSLRDTIAAAATGDTITFGGPAFSAPAGPAGSLDQVTIRLTSGRIIVNRALTINGIANADGGNKVVITGDADASGSYTAGDSRAFTFGFSLGSGTTTVHRLTFEHCGAATGEPGGAVASSGGDGGNSIVVTRCRFLSNTATTGGAWFAGDSECTNPIRFTNCRFESNSASSQGGAVAVSGIEGASFHSCDFVENNASAGGATAGALQFLGSEGLVENCSFSGNTATNNAGALQISNSAVTLHGSTFSGNSSGRGGALVVLQDLSPSLPVEIRHCTFSGNTAQTLGGAIHLTDATAVTLHHCTLTGNQSNAESGAIDEAAALTLRDDAHADLGACLIAGNTDSRALGTATPDVNTVSGGTAGSLGGNVIGDNSGSGTSFKDISDLDGTAASPLDPGLLPLADNGGPTRTHALHPFSPARDFATASTATEDQRGEARPSGGAPDAGAFERQVISFADWAADRLAAFPVSERQANDDPDGDGLSNGIEFVQGTAPATANLPLDRVETDAAGTWYSFTISNEADIDTLTAEIERSDDLTEWEIIPLNGKGPDVVFDSANASRSRYRLPVSTAGRPACFLRLNVRPLQMNP